MRRYALPLTALLAALFIAACDSSTTSAPIPVLEASVPDGSSVFVGNPHSDAADGAKSVDAAKDAAHDAGADATMQTGSDGGSDAASPADARKDSGADAAIDAPPAKSDAADAALADSGAADVGVEAAATAGDMPPMCETVDGGVLGWYTSANVLLCADTCTGLTPMCQRIGTSSQGWYTTMNHGCPPHSTEILNDPSCQ